MTSSNFRENKIFWREMESIRKGKEQIFKFIKDSIYEVVKGREEVTSRL